MKSKQRQFAKQLLALVLIASLSPLATAELYRYRGANNEIVIDDRIPSEFVHKGYEVLNSSGFVIERVERAPTKEEMAQISEEKRQEEERKRQKERDEWLLDRFSDAGDAVRARDRQLGALNTLIVFGENKIKKLKEDEQKELEYAAAEERAGKDVSKDVLDRIESIRETIRGTEAQIDSKKSEQEKIKVKYQEFIDRLKEIEAAKAKASAVDSEEEDSGWGS